MTATVNENATAPVPAGWTWKLDAGQGRHWPLYVSPPDPDFDGQQDAIKVEFTTHRETGEHSVHLTFLSDVRELETRDGINEELADDEGMPGDSYWLDAEASAGLAAWLLSALTLDGKFLDKEGLGRWVPKIMEAALKLNEAHADRLHAEIDKISGGGDH